MGRFDYFTLATTAALSAGGVLVASSAEDRFLAVVVVLTLGAAVIAANHSIPRRPRLEIEYRNPELGGRPIVWRRGPGSGNGPVIEVVLKNVGHGAGEAIEAQFSKLGATYVLNESGNHPTEVDVTVNPPRFTARHRVLNPGQEWAIASLLWLYEAQPTATGSWRASARGVSEVVGSVELTMLDEPPAAE